MAQGSQDTSEVGESEFIDALNSLDKSPCIKVFRKF